MIESFREKEGIERSGDDTFTPDRPASFLGSAMAGLKAKWFRMPRRLRACLSLAGITLTVLNLEEAFKFLQLDRAFTNTLSGAAQTIQWVFEQTWLPTFGAAYVGTLLALVTFLPVLLWLRRSRRK